ncbi:hypothetical protein FM115_03335 [Marinilactibacillus psychrotolerans 42ea]|uniref:Uncharacterized protein n=1 Tax=Marinilactibacillus psychrotolerans 42ea TaxID=1255609 RepID=A0A1R4IZV0_9LACT|nr:hypothetical protein FM115_03335 [Marinilactibacillus psychrotolerans 42ea]
MTIDFQAVAKISMYIGIICLVVLLVASFFNIVKLPNVVPVFVLLISLTSLLVVIKMK